MSHTHHRRGTLPVAALVLVGLVGCSQLGIDTGGSGPSATQTKEAVPPATIAVSVPTGAADVRPDTVVTVASTRGTIKDVQVTAADGAPVPGELSDDKTSWVSTSPLALETAYTVSGSAENPEGSVTPLSSNFTTLKPRDTEEASITPTASMQTVGVAMPIVVLFDSAPVDKAAAERRLNVTTSSPIEGSWRWTSDKQVVWRPRDYWPSGTKVDVTADMTGVEFAKNVWGTNTEPIHFEIGRNQTSVVDISGYTLTVKQNDNVIKTIPVTNGQGSGRYATREGTKVIITKENSHRMRAPGFNEDDPEYYDLVVRYAMRLTWSGEFIHAAPWSVGSQGRRNVSHGCTGMSTSNARWMMENSLIGDPVTYINGRRKLTNDNGWAFWNMSYDEWKTGSALYVAPPETPQDQPAAEGEQAAQPTATASS